MHFEKKISWEPQVLQRERETETESDRDRVFIYLFILYLKVDKHQIRKTV